jgi:NTE family protein
VSVPAKWWRRGGASPLVLNVALQGGGAHGAFTAGVLDALLAEPRIGFEGLSGSSAGAMNAVVLAHGWLAGGREGARQALAGFWTAIGKQMPPGLVSQGEGDAIGLSPAGKMLATWAGFFSPTQLNPFDLNPLRELLAQQIDFERLRAASPFKLFIGATQANTGKLRIFREHELTLEMLLASACLPKIHRSVEIDGEPYWDGGYSGNPAVFPLFYDCNSRDVLLVLLSPLQREGALLKREDIEARIVELAFSANFMREMRMFAQALSFSRPTFMTFGRLERRLQAMRFHMIDASHLASLERTETKLLAHGPYLERLAAQGRARAAMWIEGELGGVGRRSTVDLVQCFG